MEKNFKIYEVEDFLQEETFVSWAKTGHDPHQFWKNFIQNNPEKAEIIAQARQLATSLRFNEIPSNELRKEESWKIIERNMAKKPKFRLIRWTISAAAAAIALLFYVGSLNEGALNTIATKVSETRQELLPDGSMVQLNAGSQIKYSKDKFSNHREIFLDGEAFFEVKKGEKFIVKTALGNVEVLGTSFNIFSREGVMMVQCYTGKVAVNFIGMDGSYILIPGQQVSNQDQRQTKSFDLTSDKNWRNGYFYFEEKPLSVVLEELKRQYNIKEIKATSEVKNQLYTGYFQKGDLQAAIQSVCLPLQLEGLMSDDVLILTGKNE